MTSYSSTIEPRHNVSKVNLPCYPTLDDINEGGGPPAAKHYTKETIAALQCITVLSQRRKPDVNLQNTRMYVGNAFAFSFNYLFTTFHTICENDPDFRIESIWISDRLDPTIRLYKLEVVGVQKAIDVAVLRCRDVHFSRLSLQATSLQTFRSVYTVNRVESRIVTVPLGRAYPGPQVYMGRCDAPSAQERSGGPVLDTKGQVIGMLKGTLGEVEGVFVTTEGLLYALARIDNSRELCQWGIKAAISEERLLDGAEPRERYGIEKESRKRPLLEVMTTGRESPKTSKLTADSVDSTKQHVKKYSWKPTPIVLPKLMLTGLLGSKPRVV
ncbi:MAG: hypothetical protein Q9187_007135 [Circinaria calcarea]